MNESGPRRGAGVLSRAQPVDKSNLGQYYVTSEELHHVNAASGQTVRKPADFYKPHQKIHYWL
jgi:hypothetical protein